jgi:hypothetical protein
MNREPLQAGSLPLCVLEVENFELDIRSGSHHVIERVYGTLYCLKFPGLSLSPHHLSRLWLYRLKLVLLIHSNSSVPQR